MERAMKRITFKMLFVLVCLLLFSACGGLSPEEVAATLAQSVIYDSQTQTAAAPTATLIPTDTPTNTPAPTATFTPTTVPTATFTPIPKPCSHLNLTGRWVDIRDWYGVQWGYILYLEQNGCELTGKEFAFASWAGESSAGDPYDVHGEVFEDQDKVRLCIPALDNFCLPLGVLKNGTQMANGYYGWTYDLDETWEGD
jgi:hypothetical protein